MNANLSKPRKRGRPPTGVAKSAAERMRAMRARKKSLGLKPVTRWVENAQVSRYSDHRLADVRSLAIHVVVAEQILRNPALLRRAEEVLNGWVTTRMPHLDPWLVEWQTLLQRPVAEVLGAMTELTENGARLRQSSPFAPLLGAAHRKRIREALRP